MQLAALNSMKIKITLRRGNMTMNLEIFQAIAWVIFLWGILRLLRNRLK